MRALFIDLASHDGLLAAVDARRAVAVEHIDHRIADDALLPLVEKMLQAAGWSYADLTHIACVTGPGGFTSIRGAVALANTLADQLKIPLAGVHLSEVYAVRALGPKSEACPEPSRRVRSPTLWLHSTKSTSLFIRGFGNFASLWPEPTLISVEELQQRCPNAAPWCGELLLAHQQAFAHTLSPVALSPTEEILPQLLAGLPYKEESIVPWYGRGW